MDLVPLKKHNLTRAQFEQLADIPRESGIGPSWLPCCFIMLEKGIFWRPKNFYKTRHFRYRILSFFAKTSFLFCAMFRCPVRPGPF